jgi:SAM-dependent methyltransferase
MAVDGLKRRLEDSSSIRELGRRLPPWLRRGLRTMLALRAARRTRAEQRAVASFLEPHGADIWGVVLEVESPVFTHRLGGTRVGRSEVVDIRPGNELATIVADLSEPGSLPPDEFDCVLLLQVLHQVSDPQTALANAWRALAPGGALLVTVPNSGAALLGEPPLDGPDPAAHSGPVAGARAQKPRG